MRKISVQQGLNELKLLDGKINKLISGLDIFVPENKNGELHNVKNKSKLEDQKSSLASLLQLIKNRSELKQKIVQSNAVTKVRIANVEYTVAEAIEKKDSITYDQNLLHKLKRSLAETELVVQRYNNELDSQLQSSINIALGSSSDKQENSAKQLIEVLTKRSEESKLSVKDFNVEYAGKNISVLKLHDVIDDEVQAFLSEVDYALTHSNVLTEIELND